MLGEYRGILDKRNQAAERHLKYWIFQISRHISFGFEEKKSLLYTVSMMSLDNDVMGLSDGQLDTRITFHIIILT